MSEHSINTMFRKQKTTDCARQRIQSVEENNGVQGKSLQRQIQRKLRFQSCTGVFIVKLEYSTRALAGIRVARNI